MKTAVLGAWDWMELSHNNTRSTQEGRENGYQYSLDEDERE